MGWKAIDWVFDRLGEKSTYQGLAALLAAGGVGMNPELLPHITALGLSLFGIVSVVKKDKGWK